jgi:hypothetical protein
MTIADEIEETAFRIEAGARAHQCMGADCATCNPNGVGSQLRGIADRVRDLEGALAGHQVSLGAAIAELNAKNARLAGSVSFDPVTRPDLDPVREQACSARKALAAQQAAFDDPLRVNCPTCGARAPRPCSERRNHRRTG